MEITPDHLVVLRWGWMELNATLVYTWLVILLLVVVSWLGTRTRLGSRLRPALEAIVAGLRGQIREISGSDGADDYLPFIGTLFLFVAVSNELDAVPGWCAPTGSLSTTAALALCVAVSVPVFGIRKAGLRGYLHHYLTPTALMLPIHVISEISRTLALAIRLFGNIMSGSMVVALLLALAPLFFPMLMQVLGLLIGLIQAYIFAVLAMVYIAAAVRRQAEAPQETT
jgi:F-type H+-transporting ATPase subunit a